MGSQQIKIHCRNFQCLVTAFMLNQHGLQLVINTISNLTICWGYSSSQATINTKNLPISYNNSYVVIGNSVSDFQDGYVTSVSTYKYNLSQFQYVCGGWEPYGNLYASDIYYICVGT